MDEGDVIMVTFLVGIDVRVVVDMINDLLCNVVV